MQTYLTVPPLRSGTVQMPHCLPGICFRIRGYMSHSWCGWNDCILISAQRCANGNCSKLSGGQVQHNTIVKRCVCDGWRDQWRLRQWRSRYRSNRCIQHAQRFTRHRHPQNFKSFRPGKMESFYVGSDNGATQATNTTGYLLGNSPLRARMAVRKRGWWWRGKHWRTKLTLQVWQIFPVCRHAMQR